MASRRVSARGLQLAPGRPQRPAEIWARCSAAEPCPSASTAPEAATRLASSVAILEPVGTASVTCAIAGLHAAEPGTGDFAGVADEEHGIHHWARRGIAGRAVLADLARWRAAIGRPLRHDESDAIDPGEIAECLAAKGNQLAEGDILLVRTGWVEWYQRQASDVRTRFGDVSELKAPGLPRRATSSPGRCGTCSIAAIGCDNPSVEVWPPSQLTRGGGTRRPGRS